MAKSTKPTEDREYRRFLGLVGRRIRALRKERGLTQEDMGRFGFERRWIQRIENGENPMTLHTLYRLARVLNVSPGELLADT